MQRNKKFGLFFIRLFFYCRDLAFMAVTNFTQDKNQATIQELYCSAEFTREVHMYSGLIGLSAINIFLSVTAFLGNTLILFALHKETSLHPPSKLLYRNLAITDLCVGIIVQPLAVVYWISAVTGRWNICYYAHLPVTISATGLCAVSLLTLTAISVDRLLALLLGLRYRQVVTFRRTGITLLGMWIFSILGTSSFLWDPVIHQWYTYSGVSLSLVALICSNTKIFSILRHNQIQVQNHIVQGQPSLAIPALNIARYRKAVYSALWVQGTLVFLLSATRGSSGFDTCRRDAHFCLPCQAIYGLFSFLKLFIKPFAVLLEDQRSEKSCERLNKTTLLLIELVCCHLCLIERLKLKKSN